LKFLEGSRDNPKLFQTSKELFEAIKKEREKENDYKAAFGSSTLVQFEEEKFIQQ